MIQILNKEYSNLQPVAPSKNAVAIFNVEDAIIAFSYPRVDFVVALNEDTMRFAYIHSVAECIEFYKPVEAPIQEKFWFDDRQWNYFFNEGDSVVFADDVPSDNPILDWLSKTYLKLEDYKGKIGTVEKCYADLHCIFGSAYNCDVNFEGKTISLMAAYFVKHQQ